MLQVSLSFLSSPVPTPRTYLMAGSRAQIKTARPPAVSIRLHIYPVFSESYIFIYKVRRQGNNDWFLEKTTQH